jgi:hypothetical protein
MIPKSITVHTMQVGYKSAPIWLTLKKPEKPGDYWLETDSHQAAAQVLTVGKQSFLVWIEPDLPKGARRTYRVKAMSGQGIRPDKIEIAQTESGIDFRLNQEIIAAYVYKGAPKPYIYPLLGPNGKPITRHFPMKAVPGETTDHPHHRSLWFTHGEVNGIDFWSEGNNRGRILYRQFEAIEGGMVLARVRAINDWMGPDGKKVCEDVTEFRIYNTAGGRVLEYEVEIRATEGDVLFGDTKEGTFGVRVACNMEVTRKTGGQIVNARGQRDTATWGKPAEWCDYTGQVEGDVVGIAIFDHPSNLRHPTTWHVRDYGLFAVNPFGMHDFNPGTPDGTGDYTLKRGQTRTFRYRLWLHRGRTEEAGVAAQYDAYRNEPEIGV